MMHSLIQLAPPPVRPRPDEDRSRLPERLIDEYGRVVKNLRLSITDRHQLASYDVVTAGPRFAVSGQGRGVDGLAPTGDDDDGLVSVTYEFVHLGAAAPAAERA